MQPLLVCAGIAVCLLPAAGCKDGSSGFRRVLHSAARDAGNAKQPVGGPKKGDSRAKLAVPKNKNSIPSCPEGARLYGSAYPKGTAQWCAVITKDGKTQRHGEYRRWHKSGNMKQQAFYKHGKLHGTMKIWYPGGNPKESISYAEGVRDGATTEWNKDGTKRMQGSFEMGKKHGAFSYWGRGGTLTQKGSYSQDQKHGVWISYHRSGQIKERGEWRNGKKSGRSEQMSRDGVLMSVEEYLDNIPHGQWLTFYSNGNKKSEGRFVKGQKHGTWTDYRKDGGIQKTTLFEAGIIKDVREEARGSARPRRLKSRRRTRFGSGDILGAEPPIPDRRTPAAPAPSRSEQSPREELSKSDGWESL